MASDLSLLGKGGYDSIAWAQAQKDLRVLDGNKKSLELGTGRKETGDGGGRKVHSLRHSRSRLSTQMDRAISWSRFVGSSRQTNSSLKSSKRPQKHPAFQPQGLGIPWQRRLRCESLDIRTVIVSRHPYHIPDGRKPCTSPL